MRAVGLLAMMGRIFIQSFRCGGALQKWGTNSNLLLSLLKYSNWMQRHVALCKDGFMRMISGKFNEIPRLRSEWREEELAVVKYLLCERTIIESSVTLAAGVKPLPYSCFFWELGCSKKRAIRESPLQFWFLVLGLPRRYAPRNDRWERTSGS